MSIETDGHRGYQFGEFVLDIDRGALIACGNEIHLRPQSFAVLRYLVERHGTLVSRDELLDAVWGNKAVTGDSVTQCLIEIRRAIGDGSQTMIGTVPRRGYVFEATVSALPEPGSATPTGSAVLPQPGRIARLFYAALTALGIAVAVLWMTSGTGDSDASAAADSAATVAQPSIAVLPFADMSAGGDQLYFAHGLSEEILHLLAQIPEMIVIARASSFAIAKADIATVGAVLDVGFVLEGSVRKAGDRVRVTAQLIDTADSSHVWSRSWDRELVDILDVQSEIAAAVARELHVTFRNRASVAASASRDAVAYEEFLRGRYYYNRRAPGDILRASKHLRQALTIDPEFPEALVQLVAANNVRLDAFWRDSDSSAVDEESRLELVGQQRERVERMLELAADRPEAHIRAAQFYDIINQPAVSNGHARQAAELDPNHRLVRADKIWTLVRTGRLDEAITAKRLFIRSDPLSALNHNNLGAILEFAGRLPEADAAYRQAIELQGLAVSRTEVGSAAYGLVRVLILQERFEEGLAEVLRWPDGSRRRQALGMIHHATGAVAESDELLAGIDVDASRHNALLAIEYLAFTGRNDAALDRLPTLAVGESCPDYTVQEAYFSRFLSGLRNDPRMKAWRDDVARAYDRCTNVG